MKEKSKCIYLYCAVDSKGEFLSQ
ncbi:hypothetical protein FQP34_05330 [Peribacillus simplex]|uniref:Uncharacterized protein n=1 Tax=Peribacillus simplex TaxID=1478 RepID=A0A8B5Y3T2_9BACI|nr:hypothetical protein FQP34_05330 [Peribacillus simplex]